MSRILKRGLAILIILMLIIVVIVIFRDKKIFSGDAKTVFVEVDTHDYTMQIRDVYKNPASVSTDIDGIVINQKNDDHEILKKLMNARYKEIDNEIERHKLPLKHFISIGLDGFGRGITFRIYPYDDDYMLNVYVPSEERDMQYIIDKSDPLIKALIKIYEENDFNL